MTCGHPAGIAGSWLNQVGVSNHIIEIEIVGTKLFVAGYTSAYIKDVKDMNESITRNGLRNVLKAALLFGACAVLPASAAQTPEEAAKDLGLSTSSSFQSVSFTDALHGWAVDSDATIIATVDGGAHWIRQKSGIKNELENVYFTDPQHGWIVSGEDDILATEDGGLHWIKQHDPLNSEMLGSVYFTDSAHGWIIGRDAHLLATVDGGKHWSPEQPLNHDQIRGLNFIDNLNGWIVQGLIIETTSDGGLTWQKLADLPDASFGGIIFKSLKQGWAIGHTGIFATNDGGLHWQQQYNLEHRLILADRDFIDPLHGWVVGGEGTILATKDGGKTWQQQTSGVNELLTGVSFVDAQHGWIVGYKGIVLATSDGGTTWKPQLSAYKPEKSAVEESRSPPPRGSTKNLAVVGYNYTNRYISQFRIDGASGGDVNVSSETGGGGGISCCEHTVIGVPPGMSEVTWAVGACTYDNHPDRDGTNLFHIHHFFKTVKVKVQNKPENPNYAEVHFYPDGHVEVTYTETMSDPRLSLSRDREDRSDYPVCPDNKEPK